MLLLVWSLALLGVAGWLHFRLPSPELLYSWCFGATGAAAVLTLSLSTTRKAVLMAFALGALATALVDGPRTLTILMALETFLLLAWNGQEPTISNPRYYIALALGLFGAAAFQLPALAPYLIGAFIALRALAIPMGEDDISEPLLLGLAGISVLQILFLSGLRLAPGMELALGSTAVVAALWGRPWPALICAFGALCVLAPQSFIFAGPFIALLTAGVPGLRAASALCGLVTYFVLMNQLADETIIGAALAGAAAGLTFWTRQRESKPWPGIVVAAVALGVAIYFNLEWFAAIQPISTPEELAGVGAWAVSVTLGYWLWNRTLPIQIRAPSLRLRTPSFRGPRVRFSQRPVAFAERLSSSQYFVAFGFLSAATLLVWLVEAYL